MPVPVADHLYQRQLVVIIVWLDAFMYQCSSVCVLWGYI